METFEMSRAVGRFDVFYAPLNGIGMLDVSLFSEWVERYLKFDRKKLGLDLSGLVTINSSAFNCLFQTFELITAAKGEFVIVVDNEDMLAALNKYGIQNRIKIFKSEAELLDFSIHGTSEPSDAHKTHRIPAITGTMRTVTTTDSVAPMVEPVVEPSREVPVPEESGSSDGIIMSVSKNYKPSHKSKPIVAPSAFEDYEEASGANLWVLAVVAIIGVGIVLLYLLL